MYTLMYVWIHKYVAGDLTKNVQIQAFGEVCLQSQPYPLLKVQLVLYIQATASEEIL